MARIIPLLLIIIFIVLFPAEVRSEYSNGYVVAVNPIRDRRMWQDINLLSDQIKIFLKEDIPANWLITYSNLFDNLLTEKLKQIPTNQEIGIFLEVDQNLAEDSLVGYLLGEGDWARPDKVFLSGYEIKERQRMIDVVFEKFKQIFGFYPKIVGSWYIDAFSLSYLVDKYQITAVIQVADQYQTDKYGIWGRPWGTPYYPSKFNTLVPANSFKDKLPVVLIQWAQRDPLNGYGSDVFSSTYSVQANDYIAHHQLNIDYFKKLAESYLFSANDLNQLTIGIEVGQEGKKYIREYEKQVLFLKSLSNKGKIAFLSMSEFAQKFSNLYPELSPNYFIKGKDIVNQQNEAFWFSSPLYRIGLIMEKGELKIRDLRSYNQNFIFLDFVSRDRNTKLERIIPPLIDASQKDKDKLLFSKVKQIQTQRMKKDMLINIEVLEQGSHDLTLTTDEIFLDNRSIYKFENKNNLLGKLERELLNAWLYYSLVKNHSWSPSIRWSYIENNYYFGYWIKPELYIGIRNAYPYLGKFYFPFQILTRFKTIPSYDFSNILAFYFINLVNRSTIKNN